MARSTKPQTRIAVIEETPAGDRARYTLPVREDVEGAALRAQTIADRIAGETGNPVRLRSYTCAA